MMPVAAEGVTVMWAELQKTNAQWKQGSVCVEAT